MAQPANTRSPSDEIFRQRATQAAIWALPTVSNYRFRAALATIGAAPNDVIYFSRPMDQRQEFLTPNNQTPYVLGVIDTRPGPMVVELPAASAKVALFGSFLDAWQVPIEDFGPAGADAGKGGRYLLLPPGHEGAVPDAYIVLRSSSYFVTLGGRPIPLAAGSIEDAVEASKAVRVYPLDDPSAPTNYVDGYPKAWSTIPIYDLTYFRDIAAALNAEPTQLKDAAMIGMLASIGIERGRAFNPPPEQAALFEQALQDAYNYVHDYFVAPGKGYAPYWPDRQWGVFNLTEKQDFTFLVDNHLLIDERASFFFWATALPKKLGATSYLLGVRDADGALFSGAKTYRLRVPADTPARDFWSVIVYSMRTKAFVPNALNRVGLSSFDKSALQMNDDGSADIWFGPWAPSGQQSNWIPTGEEFFLLFRLYGPEPPFLERVWTLPDVEEVFAEDLKPSGLSIHEEEAGE